jgi:prepilin-type N-terminal cleavage/methylation domain-containing protein
MRRTGFTIIELLVTVSIIALLIAILLPAMSNARELARRTVCATHFNQIFLASMMYADSNRGVLFTSAAKIVQHGFHPEQVDQMHTVGLSVGPRQSVGIGTPQYLPAPVWNCPSRNFQSRWDPPNGAMFVAAQYFGGMTTWHNPLGAYRARSPVTVSSSRGDWVLACDSTMKIDGVWGGGTPIFADQPSHKQRNSAMPAGQNQVYMDGSVGWVDVSKLIFIHSWNVNGSRNAYFWQQDMGSFTPTSNLYAINDP